MTARTQDTPVTICNGSYLAPADLQTVLVSLTLSWSSEIPPALAILLSFSNLETSLLIVDSILSPSDCQIASFHNPKTNY